MIGDQYKMIGLFKKKSNPNKKIKNDDSDNKNKTNKTILNTITGFVASASAKDSTNIASKTYAKPDKYSGNRKIYDSGSAKKNVKIDLFSNNSAVYDPYTNKELLLRKHDAKIKYGDDWQSHLAESDHVVPLAKVANDNIKNPWLKNIDIKNVANSTDNMEIISRKYNNAKRDRTNEEFVHDEKYLKSQGLELTSVSKQAAINKGKIAQKSINNQLNKVVVKNIINNGHTAGKSAFVSSGSHVATISSITNITAVIKGEKSVDDAIADTMVDSGKAATTGYLIGGGLATVLHTLSSSSSKFIQSLSKSNVPGQVITSVMVAGNTMERYVKGEINTKECLIELGDRGLTFASAAYSGAVGQTLIPIPVVGYAVGAFVGSTLTSQYYKSLVNDLNNRQLEHQERQRILAECEIVLNELKAYEIELESYINSYFKEYNDCFDIALTDIKIAFQSGDANGVISGANQITKKLGGKVYYETVDEFIAFLDDDSTFIL